MTTKTKQDIFELLAQHYEEAHLREGDVTIKSYAQKFNVKERIARRILERAVENGLLIVEKVTQAGVRVNRFLPTPGWEKKANGNIFAQISKANGHKPARNSKRAKRGRI